MTADHTALILWLCLGFLALLVLASAAGLSLRQHRRRALRRRAREQDRAAWESYFARRRRAGPPSKGDRKS